jgi:hypothetical protein
MAKVTALVSELYKQCSFDLRTPKEKLRGPAAASDCCGKWANNVTVDADNRRWYRCTEHQGWLNPDTEGLSILEVEL